MHRKRVALSLVLAMLAGLFGACEKGGPSAAALGPSEAFSATASVPVAASELEVPPPLAPLPSAEGMNPFAGTPLAEGAQPGQRPVAVMGANSERSLPQRGLASADVLIEALAEGGATRYMALYGDSRTVPPVGPVYAAQDPFVQFAVPASAVFAHIGSNGYADNLLNVLRYQDVDGIYLGTTAFYYDFARSAPVPGGSLNEYCWFTDANYIAAGAVMAGVPPTGEVRQMFQFTDAPAEELRNAYHITGAFSDTASVGFDYDPVAGVYVKTRNGQGHTDEDGSVLAYLNVLLLSCPVGEKPDGRFPEYDLRGGTGVYFVWGNAYPITWRKGAPSDPLRLFLPDGSELQVRRGHHTYIGVLPGDRPAAITYTGP